MEMRMGVTIPIIDSALCHSSLRTQCSGPEPGRGIRTYLEEAGLRHLEVIFRLGRREDGKRFGMGVLVLETASILFLSVGRGQDCDSPACPAWPVGRGYSGPGGGKNVAAPKGPQEGNPSGGEPRCAVKSGGRFIPPCLGLGPLCATG